MSPGDIPANAPSWIPEAIFYQIFPDRFARSERLPQPAHLEAWDAPPTPHGFKGGDLFGIAERLDHIEALGANAIYLNPIFASASNHRYQTYDYYQVDPLLGGNLAFRELLDAAHARGIRVILDGVFNHVGRGFWQFHHLLETGEQSPYADWFLPRSWPLNAYDRGRKPNYAAWWDLPSLPKLKVENPAVREFLLGVAEHWTRFGIDGWRLDVPGEITAPGFWPEFRRRVRAINPEAYLVGEVWDEGREWLHGDRFDGLTNYPFTRTALGLCATRIDQQLRHGDRRVHPVEANVALMRLFLELEPPGPHAPCAQLNLLSSHDVPRFLTLCGGDHTALHLATLLQMTLPGAPCIYYGDEIGLEGGADPDCRRGFSWPEERWHMPTWEVFRKAAALRRSEPLLCRGPFKAVLGKTGVLCFLRPGVEESILVILNTTTASATRVLPLPDQAVSRGDPRELWANEPPPLRPRAAIDGERGIEVQIPPRSASVLKLAWAPESTPGP